MQKEADRYYIVHKPYDMVSQFVSSHRVRVLGDLGFDFPAGTHPIGRLDNDSEGLLILTTDRRVTKLLFQGKVPHRRTYLVKVKYIVSEESLVRLRQGVSIQVRGGGYYVTAPCAVERVGEEDVLAAGVPPPQAADGGAGVAAGEEEGYVPVTWLRIVLTEGKFHQVRKMVAAVGHRCIRLLRVSIEGLELDGLAAGGVREVGAAEFFERLKIG
ncbi:MAG TPA: pseudouridine synthase [Puia sp.]|nr:pseudouridine synthase [Puia sp.]